MPGIVGLVTRMPREWANARLQRMVQSICHESFYETGTLADEALGVFVGWVERKNSFSRSTSLSSESGDLSLIFSGEEYREPESVRSLQKQSCVSGSSSPPYLLQLLEDDAAFPLSLNGRFHGIALDRKSGTAKLFNDRYGMHRLYYHEAAEAFYFAAEAKSILEVQPELRAIDSRSLGEFVNCGCVLDNRSLFKNVNVIPPGSAWTFARGALEKKESYFQPKEWENQERLAPEAYYQELRDVLTQKLPSYFDEDQHIGMSLTGGLDSRMIMALHPAAPGSLPCYTFGGTYRECQDVVVSRQVAEACHQPYQVIPVGKDFLSDFARYAERAVYLTDGCVRVNRAADLYVNQLAREIAPVRMTGNYGSEVLRWVPAFKPGRPDTGIFAEEFVPHVDAASDTYGRALSGHPVSFAVFRQAPWHHYGLLALEQTQLSVRSPYLDNDLVRTVFRAPDPAIAKTPQNSDICMRLISDGNKRLAMIPTDLGLSGNGSGLSAKARRQLLKFTFKAEYAYDVGMPQWMARADNSLSRLHLERLFLGRHKFSHFRVWYRDALGNYVREMLLDQRALARPYLQGNRVKSLVEGHLRGSQNHTNDIHLLLTLELIHRLFID